MKVYLLISAFEETPLEKVAGVFLTTDDALRMAASIVDERPLRAVLVNKDVNPDYYAVVNQLGNCWFFIVPKEVKTKEWKVDVNIERVIKKVM